MPSRFEAETLVRNEHVRFEQHESQRFDLRFQVLSDEKQLAKKNFIYGKEDIRTRHA